MSHDIVYNALNIINHNGNILDLFGQNYDFSKIKNLFDYLKKREYVKYDDDLILKVTEKGILFINEYQLKNNEKKYSQWILPNKQMWTEPMNKFKVYIPKK